MDDITAKISTKGQMTVPKAARDALGLTGGSELVFRVDNGRAMVARTKRLLDTAAAPPHELTVMPRLPWDANRHSRLQMRSKPRSILRKAPTWLDPLTEFTVDLRPVPETEDNASSAESAAGDIEA